MLLCLPVFSLHAQQRISGQITLQTDGEPAVGVTVKLKNSSTGTVTGADGRYSMDVPGPDAVLQFEYTGFATQEIAVGNRAAIEGAHREPAVCALDRFHAEALSDRQPLAADDVEPARAQLFLRAFLEP